MVRKEESSLFLVYLCHKLSSVTFEWCLTSAFVQQVSEKVKSSEVECIEGQQVVLFTVEPIPWISLGGTVLFFPFEFMKRSSRSFVIEDGFNSCRCISAVQIVHFAGSHYNKWFIVIILPFAHPGHITIKILIRSVMQAEVFRIFI